MNRIQDKKMSKTSAKPEKEKTSAAVADKVFKFFGLNKSNTSQSTSSSSGSSSSLYLNNGCHQISSITSKMINELQVEYELSVDQKTDISRKSSISTRIRTIRELEDMVENKRLFDFTVEYILNETMDLLEDNQSSDVRLSVWKFYKCLVRGQNEKLTNLRYLVLDLIIRNDLHDEDIPLRLDLLVALTDNGKSIEYFERRIGPFVVDWFEKIVSTVSKLIVEFLSLLANLIKFNATYFDQLIIANIILKTCQLTNRVTTNEEMRFCYQILDVILCYSNIPSETLTQFVLVLCKGVNINAFHEICVKIMRKLLGTHLGHSCVDTLRYLLNDEMNHEEISLMRGAIHFLTQSLWDEMRVGSLKHSPNSVFPAYKCALECKNPFVALEVTLSVTRFIDFQSKDISEYTWDLILDICEILVSNYDISNQSNEFPIKVHKLFDKLEELHQSNTFFGDSNKLFDILEKCSIHRSEQSVKRLIEYRALSVQPEREYWIEALKYLIDHYFKKEKRTTLRIKALDVLEAVLKQYRYIHEEELVESIILPFLSHIELDCDTQCRDRAVQLLVDLALESISAKHCSEILDILERICRRPFEQNKANNCDSINISSDNEAVDVKKAIRGLIAIFKKKLFSQPTSSAIQAFKLLVSHLSAHYMCIDYTCIGQIGSAIKQEIFDLVVSIRANIRGQIGVFQRSHAEDPLKYSLFIMCERNEMSPNASTAGSPTTSTLSPQTLNSLSPPPSPLLQSVNSSNSCVISFQEMFKVLIICLNTEKDWTVLKLVLSGLPKFLKNKAIILSGNPKVAIEICSALCYLICERSLKCNDFYSSFEQKLSKADIQSFAYSSLSAMVGYQSELEFRQQCTIIKCLQNGLVLVSGKTSVLRQCILSLTICAIEMQEAMTKSLHETLLSLSKISATVALSIPKLEFLSNVILLPRLYQSFTMDQYMSVFAIALPYTNPFKFNEYTVALAHRVIAMWFLKCRLPCRKSIVPFIIKGLQTNVMQEDMPHSNQFNDAQRLRSSSLNTEQSFTHKKLEARISLTSSPPPSTPQSSHSHFSFSFSSDSVNQHSQQHSPQQLTSNSISENEYQESRLELVETCMDMLSSYTFGMCSTVPLKSPMVEHLLDRTKSETWVLGHKLITITTSGCGSRATTNGLCDKCANLCRTSDSQQIEDMTHIINNYDNKAVLYKSFDLKNNSEQMCLDNDKFSRRRHQSEMQHILRPQSSLPQSSAYDDSYLINSNQKMNSFPNTQTSCCCWCQGWAEILIRRPTGNTSWIVRLQNSLGNFPYSSSPPDELPDLTALLHPNTTKQSDTNRFEFQNHTNFDSNESESGSSADSVFKTTSSLEMDESVYKKEFEKQKPYDLSTPPRTTPSQPVTRAASFGSKIRSDSKMKLLDKREFRSNDLESNSEYYPQNASLIKEGSHQTIKSKSPLLPLRINEAEYQTHGHRDRVHTISVMSPVQNINRRSFSKEVDGTYSIQKSSGLCPKFVFLQYYYNSMIDEGLGDIRNVKDFGMKDKVKPVLLPKTEANDRSLKNLDRITPYETHKIGVLYVGPAQEKDKTAILSNHFGSSRYVNFLRGLGNFIRLEDADSLVSYVGGLDTKGQDGKYALSWEDNLIQVIFHVATLMPTQPNDPNCHLKKRHIGNDFVSIVYNDSGSAINMSTIKGDGQCIQALVVITPYEYNSNLVNIQAKDDFTEIIGHYESQMLSDSALPIYVRQLALHSNLGSMVYQSRHSATPTSQHISNWVQRLKQIKRIKERVMNVSGSDSITRLPANDSADDSNAGLNQQTGDIKSQYIFPDFNDYA